MATASSAAHDMPYPESGGMTWAPSPSRMIFPEPSRPVQRGNRGMTQRGTTRRGASGGLKLHPISMRCPVNRTVTSMHCVVVEVVRGPGCRGSLRHMEAGKLRIITIDCMKAFSILKRLLIWITKKKV